MYKEKNTIMNTKENITNSLQQVIQEYNLPAEQIYQKLQDQHLGIYDDFNKKQNTLYRLLALKDKIRQLNNYQPTPEEKLEELHRFDSMHQALKDQYSPYLKVYEEFMEQYQDIPA